MNGVADDSANPDQHLYGSFNQLLELKAANPNLKVEISLGGWTKSTWFADLAPRHRSAGEAFVSPASTRSSRATCPAAAGRRARAATARPPACSTASTSTGSTRPSSPAATSTTARPIGTTRRCWRPSSASSSTRTARTTGKHYLLTAALPAATSATKYYELAAVLAVPRLGQRHDLRLQRSRRARRRRRTRCSATTRMTRTRATGPGTPPVRWRTTCCRAFQRRRSWSASRSTATSTSTCRRRSSTVSTERSTTPDSTRTACSPTRCRSRPITTSSTSPVT